MTTENDIDLANLECRVGTHNPEPVTVAQMLARNGGDLFKLPALDFDTDITVHEHDGFAAVFGLERERIVHLHQQARHTAFLFEMAGQADNTALAEGTCSPGNRVGDTHP